LLETGEMFSGYWIEAAWETGGDCRPCDGERRVDGCPRAAWPTGEEEAGHADRDRVRAERLVQDVSVWSSRELPWHQQPAQIVLDATGLSDSDRGTKPGPPGDPGKLVAD